MKKPAVWATTILLGAGSALAQSPHLQPLDGVSRVTPIVRAVRKVGPTVVNLYSEVEYVSSDWFGRRRAAETASLGAGVIVHPSGIVVTNSHVITANLDAKVLRTMPDITVNYRPDWTGHGSGQVENHKAHVLGFDPHNDLALLKINSEGPFEVATIGTSSDLMIGETVIAVGNPFGREGTVTHGIISATNRSLTGPEGDEYNDIIQTDAPLNAGNSGGPLFNIHGELIGINQAIGADRRLGRAEGQGLAIPADRVRTLLEDDFSPFALGHSYLGIRYRDTGSGVVVEDVHRRGPAADLGIQSGDQIVSVGSYEVGDLLSFNLALFSFADGQIPLTTQRAGRQQQITLKTMDIQDTVRQRLGVDLDIITDFDGPQPLVTRVSTRGPAAEVGIRKGDVILRFDGEDGRVRSWQDLFESLLDHNPGDFVFISVRRFRHGGRQERYEGEMRLQ